ncbi:hypothetical protein Pr1d_53680 [Bythopirellula goksoeyrii]|uniref:Uncharacterized protein n=1 Tax=Bythopirellula goksoeyrii TaxID=1400387 RepID=A0A5B9QKA3_9BACT|nr:hypothetical protein Pr1d_53680 [Bythopirellula goksoeyrii]
MVEGWIIANSLGEGMGSWFEELGCNFSYATEEFLWLVVGGEWVESSRFFFDPAHRGRGFVGVHFVENFFYKTKPPLHRSVRWASTRWPITTCANHVASGAARF